MTAGPVYLGGSPFGVYPVGVGTYQFAGTVTDLRAAVNDLPVVIDTSALYGTEEIVGEAVRPARESFFVATKVYPDRYRPGDLKASARTSLRTMGLDHIDLLQLHWPTDTVPIADTVGAMEDLIDEGLIRAMGVCNFRPDELRAAVRASTRHPLVTNQFAHSLYDRRFLATASTCDDLTVTVVSYSPLAGQGPDLLLARDSDGVLAAIAAREHVTPAQVAIAWTLRGGRAVSIPKSSHAARIRENMASASVALTADDLDALERSVAPRRTRSDLEERTRRAIRRTMYTEDGKLTTAGRALERFRDSVRSIKSRVR